MRTLGTAQSFQDADGASYWRARITLPSGRRCWAGPRFPNQEAAQQFADDESRKRALPENASKQPNGAGTVERRGKFWWAQVSLPRAPGERVARRKRVRIPASENLSEEGARAKAAAISDKIRSGELDINDIAAECQPLPTVVARKPVWAVPAMVSQMNSLAILGIPSRDFLTWLVPRCETVTEVGRIRIVTIENALDVLADAAKKPMRL